MQVVRVDLFEEPKEDDDDFDNTNIKTPYLQGEQVSTILYRFSEVLEGLVDSCELLYWELERLLQFGYIEASEQEIERRGGTDAADALGKACDRVGEEVIRW